MRDPAADKSLRKHVGFHSGIYGSLAQLEDFCKAVARALTLIASEETAVLEMLCTAGRHRSVAAAFLARQIVLDLKPDVKIETSHLHDHLWTSNNRTCGGTCDECLATERRVPKALSALWDSCLKVVRWLPLKEQQDCIQILR